MTGVEEILTLLLPKREAKGLGMREDEAVLELETVRLAGRGGRGGFPGVEAFGGRGRDGEYEDTVKLGYCGDDAFWISSGRGGKVMRAEVLLVGLTRS